jgi:hypothetical protein
MTGGVLRSADAANYCGIRPGTLRNLLSAGLGPKGYKQGRLNVFYPQDLDAWLESRLVLKTSPSPREKRGRPSDAGAAPFILSAA